MGSYDATSDRAERGWMTTLVILVGLGLSSPAFAAPYRHTIAIDGFNDFTAQEVFPTTTASYTVYVTWDDAYLYLGCVGPDIVYGNSTTWLLFYIDPDPGSGVGSSDGLLYNTQQPSFPAGFLPKYLYAWRVDEGRADFYQFDGVSWASIADPVNEGASSTRYVEMQVPLSAIDNPAKVGIVACLVDAASGSETTFAGMPSNAFADGYDPDFAHFYIGDFSSSRPPNDRFTLRVPEDFPTIRAAIDASYMGDSVLIGPGTYTGPDNRDLDPGTKEIVIRGVPGETIIDCENLGDGFQIVGEQTMGLHIMDLTITRAGEDGIYVEHSSPWIEGCEVTQCALTGIFMTHSDGKVDHCRLAGNSYSGIYLENSTSRIESCVIQQNGTSAGGGGIQCFSSDATIEGCEIDGNTAGSGAGVNIESGSPLVKDCRITGNRSQYTGGGIYLYQCTPTIQGCTISRNSADQGAGVFTDDADPQISTSILWGNCALVGSGDLWNDTLGTIRMSCSDLDLNGIGPASFPIEDGGIPNISVDPLFCDMGGCGAISGDFRLATASPCLAQACSGQIGVLGVGCSVTPTVHVTWGRLKGMYH